MNQNKPLKNPGVAAVLSFFFPGVGQIYNGQIIQGVLVMFIYLCALASLVIGIGFIIVPIVVLVSVLDAYREAEKYNAKL